jgi:hypothetical protein
MPAPIANPIIEVWGVDQVPPYINAGGLIPKTTAGLGLASFDLGFPEATMTDPTLGGVPMSGADMNAALQMLSQYCAAAQIGQPIGYNAAVQTAIGGYGVGAVLAKATGIGFWLSLVANNMTDPDTGGAGWTSLQPDPTLVLQLAVAPATYNDYSPTGFNAEVGYLDLSPTGSVIITGIAAPPDDQYLLVTNLSSSHSLTLNALDAGSLAQNRLRLPGNVSLVPNNSICLRYSTQLSLWVQS